MGALTVELRKGVVGGFAPAALKLQINLTLPESGSGSATVKRLTKKTFHPTDADYETKTVQVDEARVSELKQALSEIWGLPVEDPPGSEDIYRSDMTISVSDGSRTWVNLAPEGCVHAPSAAEASAEQRGTFTRIAKAVLALDA